jgi:hypothetical protein
MLLGIRTDANKAARGWQLTKFKLDKKFCAAQSQNHEPRHAAMFAANLLLTHSTVLHDAFIIHCILGSIGGWLFDPVGFGRGFHEVRS